MRNASFLLFVWSTLFTAWSSADALEGRDIEVRVNMSGENIIIDLNFAVRATRQEVWDVLIDFNRMADFVSNLKESRVVGTSADSFTIFQRGAATYGPVNFPFESTREVRLIPYHKIRTSLISGNMRKLEGTTHLIEDGGQTRVIHRTDAIPKIWIPEIVGKVFIEHEMREQFNEMRNEIIRRKRDSLLPH
ncbi:SRPBCC family protein [Nitrosospira sp. Nsp13]|uniref:SRPBCC family protein n=1 Tax=Nitrosospira sp. Nsp13 TaxID=1855332 RepID=UPI0008800DD6|nr:SRPBCC family protein [Nitrosospira sp. Nsp13]SCY17153.1 Polyketide cyclase / dehydrase and lipid transport [Nitrosospira sp. Nsp13]